MRSSVLGKYDYSIQSLPGDLMPEIIDEIEKQLNRIELNKAGIKKLGRKIITNNPADLNKAAAEIIISTVIKSHIKPSIRPGFIYSMKSIKWIDKNAPCRNRLTNSLKTDKKVRITFF